MLTEEQVDSLNDMFGLPNITLLIVFAHGKESGPWGTKISRLAEIGKKYGAEVISPDYSDLLSPDRRVDRLLGLELPPHHKLILVGSSMGAYVSIVASRVLKPSALFLMAPAIGLPTYAEAMPKADAEQIRVIHGWNDQIVPVQNVYDFAKSHKAELSILDADHQLLTCLDYLEDSFSNFLESQLSH